MTLTIENHILTTRLGDILCSYYCNIMLHTRTRRMYPLVIMHRTVWCVLNY